MVLLLKVAQLLLSFAVIALIWQPIPDVMVMFFTFTALCYVAASIAAIRDHKYGVWIAFSFTLWIGIGAALWVVGWLSEYGYSNIDELPYLVIAISLSAMFIVILHIIEWRWFLTSKSNT